MHGSSIHQKDIHNNAWEFHVSGSNTEQCMVVSCIRKHHKAVCGISYIREQHTGMHGNFMHQEEAQSNAWKLHLSGRHEQQYRGVSFIRKKHTAIHWSYLHQKATHSNTLVRKQHTAVQWSFMHQEATHSSTWDTSSIRKQNSLQQKATYNNTHQHMGCFLQHRKTKTTQNQAWDASHTMEHTAHTTHETLLKTGSNI